MTDNKIVKGYKVFNPYWTCIWKQYACPGKFEEDVAPKVCVAGMHFCKKAIDCFNYYRFNSANKVAEVVAYGEVEEIGNKCCTNKMEIVREIQWEELLEMVNSGDTNSGNRNSGDMNSGNRNSGNGNSGNRNSGYMNSGNWNSGNRNSGDMNSGDRNSGNGNSSYMNSGNWNSGYRNSGNRNSGYMNSGYWNSGYMNSGNGNSGYMNSGNWNSGYMNSGDMNSGNGNSGNWNSGNWNSGNRNSGDWNKCEFSNGCFNTKIQKIYLFDKPSMWTYQDWLNSKACQLMNTIGNILEYISFADMTDEEKAAHPESETTGGYLKVLDNSKRAVIWWQSLSDDEKTIIKSIPNFDREIFKEITGIDVENEK